MRDGTLTVTGNTSVEVTYGYCVEGATLETSQITLPEKVATTTGSILFARR
jgi:hypothetical protein